MLALSSGRCQCRDLAVQKMDERASESLANSLQGSQRWIDLPILQAADVALGFLDLFRQRAQREPLLCSEASKLDSKLILNGFHIAPSGSPVKFLASQSSSLVESGRNVKLIGDAKNDTEEPACGAIERCDHLKVVMIVCGSWGLVDGLSVFSI